jgi:hypothetical protein
MKSLLKLVIFVFTIVSVLSGSEQVYSKIENMNKGLDGYVVGKMLNDEQKELLIKNFIKSNEFNIAKFLVGDDLIVAIDKSNNVVIALNKRYKKVEQKELQKMIGEYIFKYDEPTVMAHDKMVYWVYDKDNKKLSEDDLDKWKDSLKGKSVSGTLVDVLKSKDKKSEFNPYVSIKFNSTEPIMAKIEKPKASMVNILISSNILIQKATGMKKDK